MVRDINPGPNSYGNSFPSVLTDVNGTLFFTANDGTHGPELWKSDGTDAGTMLVKDIRPGAVGGIGGYYSPGATFTSINGTLFFAANDGSSGNELWKSDGTAAGTVLVKDIKPGSNSGNPTDLTNLNGSLFFAADNGATGRELWKSDGSAAGTVLVKDINPGTDNYGGSSPGGLTDVNGTLFFSAYDGSSGYELWSSDGTTAGTLLVKDINPGSHSAYPSALTAENGTLFFAADDGTTGSELWQASAPPSPTSTSVSCSPDAGTLGSAASCTVTVTDQLSGAITPTGSVSFAAAPAGGSFGSTSCTLAAKNATAASCTVTFVPTVVGSYTITGSYGGDPAHTTSSGAGPLTAYGPTGKAVVRKIKISGTTAKVTIACTGQTGQTCPVALTMTAAEAKKTVPVGKSSKTLRARKTVVVNVPLNRTGKRLLAKLHKLPAKLVVREKGRTITAKKLTFKSNKH
jgi:ELWxxDGT repeat protein